MSELNVYMNGFFIGSMKYRNPKDSLSQKPIELPDPKYPTHVALLIVDGEKRVWYGHMTLQDFSFVTACDHEFRNPSGTCTVCGDQL